MVTGMTWLYDNESQESCIFFPFSVTDVLHDTGNLISLPMTKNLVLHYQHPVVQELI